MRLRTIIGISLFFLGGIFLLYKAEAGPENPASLGQDDSPDIRAITLPPGAIELKLEFQFPDPDKGPFLAHPLSLAVTPDGRFFISDQRQDQVFVFDKLGKFLNKFGQSGQGPGDLLRPQGILSLDSRVIVREAGNMRFQLFDMSGRYLDGFKAAKVYADFTASEDRLYATPFLPTEAPSTAGLKLIEVLDLRGNLLSSFGDPLTVNKHDLPWLNSAILTIGPRNELWVAFRFFPFVRKYSLSGNLLAEYRYSFAIASKKEGFNKGRDAERAAGGSQPYYAYVTHAACRTDRGHYLIDSAAGKRLLIFFMKANGQIDEFYWAPIAPRGFSCTGLYVREDGSGQKFYVLNASEARVEVYSVR
jgi:hypothetical protein